MKIDRVELLGLLKLLSPAVANIKSPVAELSHIWFDGQRVSAFNDVLGIRIDYPTDFVGGLLGEKLIGVVERSDADTVDIEVEEGNALLKIGRARIKLACRPIDDWFWKVEVPEHDGYAVSEEFHSSLELLLMSVGSSTVLNPEQRGITIIQDGKAADLYSTDAMSLSWVHIDTGNKPVSVSGDRLILCTPFCEQVVALKGECELKFDKGSVYCLTEMDLTGRKLEKGESRKTCKVLLFSRLVEDENPVSFEDVINQHITDKSGVPVPAEFRSCTERAMVLLTDEPLEVEVDAGQLYLYADTPYGEIDDVLKLPDHPDIKAKLDASLLYRALDGRNSLIISREAIVMRGPKNFLHILSAK